MNRRAIALVVLVLAAALWAAGPRTKRAEDVLSAVYRSIHIDIPHVEMLPRADRDSVVCVALAIYHESRGEPERGRLAVAAVTRRRVQERGMTACNVVFQAYQYEWSSKPISQQVPQEPATWARSLRESYRVLVDGEMSGYFANHFWGHRVINPGWARSCVRREVIGQHTFCQIPTRRW